MTDTHPLSSQVGGHAGVLATDDGSLIIKPALPLEAKFYQAIQQDPVLESLRPFVPKFIGTLKLEGQLDEKKSADEGNISVTPVDASQKDEYSSSRTQSLVLENLSHTFSKPNILDVKLGTILYDESASPEKVERMIQAAKNTTSLETGVRLTGFQVYDNVTQQAVNTPKAYGKSIRPADLPDGMMRFFPVGEIRAAENAEMPADGSHSGNSGLPASTLLPILRGIRQNVAEIKEALSQLELRMVGSSLLIIYEADWTRAEEGLKHIMDHEASDDDDDNDGDDDDDDEGVVRPGPPYLVKLIDFAHTRLTPGKGPDEGVLLGMDTVLNLVDGRIKQVEQK